MNTNCKNKNRNFLHCQRLIFDKPPEDAIKVTPMPDLPMDEEVKDNLKEETIKALDETQKHITFGPIFTKMVEDKVQIQNWSGDLAQAETDMLKYWNNKDVPDEIKAFWFGGVDKDKNPIQGVFEKLKKPKTSPEYKQGFAAVVFFRKTLIDVHLRRHQEMINNQNETVTAEPVLEKTKEVVGDVITAFKEGDGTDKALMIGAAFLLYQAYDKFKDKKIPGTDITFSDALMYGGMYWGANYLSLKVTGKSIPEHMGITDPKSSLKKTEYEKFARTFGISDGKTLDVMLQIGEVKMDRLYALYAKNKDLKEPTIDPIAAGLDIPLDDAKLYKERGVMLFNIMHALVTKAGGKKEFEERYINAKDPNLKPDWNFRTVTWDLLRLDSLKTGIPPWQIYWERMGVSVLGRRRMPVDTAKLAGEFPWPTDWQYDLVTDWDEDEKNGNKQGDGKVEVTINGIRFVTERQTQTDPTTNDVHVVYRFTIKGETGFHDVKLDKDGKMSDNDRQALEKAMEKNVKDRLQRHLFFQGAPINKDLKWVKEKGWVIENLTLPAVPAWGLAATTGDVIVRSLEDGKVSIFVTGLGANIDLYNQAAQEGYNEHRAKTNILLQPEFKGLSILYPYLATKIGAAGSGQLTLSIGKATLPLKFNTATTKWEIDPGTIPAGFNATTYAAELERKFVADAEVAKALSESQLKDEDYKKVFENMKDVFTRMPESFFKHFGTKFWEVFTKFSFNEPTSSISGEIISGSVGQQFAYEIAEHKKAETALRFREALKGAKSIQDIDKIRTDIVTKVTRDMEDKTKELILKCNERKNNKQDFSSEESMTYVNQYLATGYPNKYYENAMLDFSKVAWDMDKEGGDKSDWNKNAHKVHSQLMMVVAYHTAHISNNPTLDDTNFSDYAVRREQIERTYGYDHSKAETDPANVAIRNIFKVDPNWIRYDNLYQSAYTSFKQQSYLDYVITQVQHKAEVFANDAANIDAVIENLPQPSSKNWDIIPESEFTVPTHPNTNNVMRGMPKITDHMTVINRMYASIEEVVTELTTPQYNYTLLRKQADDIKIKNVIPLGNGVAGIPLADFKHKILAMPTRLEQEEAIKMFKNAVKAHLAVTGNEKNWETMNSVGYYLRQIWKKCKEFVGVI